MAHHVVYPQLRGQFGGVVGGSVVDDQPFHRIEAWYLSGQRADRNGERAGFVEAGNLDDEFHVGSLCDGS